LDTYSKIIRYVKVAFQCPGINTHGFYRTLQHLNKTIKSHQKHIGKPTDPATTRNKLEFLRYKDSQFALALFYFLVDPTSYTPKEGKEFSEWDWPVLEVEFDHAGSFQRLHDKTYLHQGGESKYSHSMTRDAVVQLSRRIRLVDGILNLGFDEVCQYSMKVYIPSIANQHKSKVQQRSIDVLRRRDITKELTTLEKDLACETLTWLMTLETLE
jgi:hypothetical protein